MKPKTTKKRPLKLERERVRVLAKQELQQVGGGWGCVPNQTRGPISPDDL